MKKVVHKNLLKVLTIEQIKGMRDLRRKGIPPDVIARAFNCNITTVGWHTADIIGHSYPDSETIL